MSQNAYNIPDSNGTTFLANLNAALQALATRNSGAAAPTTTYAGMVWIDTTKNIKWRRNSGNTAWVYEGTANDAPVASVSGAFTMTSAYFDRQLICTGSFTITADTIANLGSGFRSGAIVNAGTGAITVAAAAGNTINGSASITIPAGSFTVVFVQPSGTDLKAIEAPISLATADARYAPINSGVTSFNSRTGSVTLTSGDVTGALGYTPANTASTFGVGQTWTNVTASRSSGTTYTNTSSKPIMVSVWSSATGSGTSLTAVVSGVTVDYAYNGSSTPIVESVKFVVPPGATYSVTAAVGSISHWIQLS